MTDLMQNLLWRLAQQPPGEGLGDWHFHTPDRRMLGKAANVGWVQKKLLASKERFYILTDAGRIALHQANGAVPFELNAGVNAGTSR